jgi:maintenance of mitochondrial morphology protein 1
MGSRAKLANVPKLHELIQTQVHRILAGKGPWTIALPNLASIPEIKEEIKEELEAKLHTQFDIP